MKKHLLLMLGVLMSISMFSQGVLTPLKEWSTTAGTQYFFYKNVVKVHDDYTYIAGATHNASGNYDLLVAKYTDRGVLEWMQQIDGAANFHDCATALFVNDTAVYVTGTISDTSIWNSDIVTLKLDISDGSIIWQETFQASGNAWDSGADIIADDSGFVYVTGSGFNDTYNKDYITLRYNSAGTLLWNHVYDYQGAHDVGVKLMYDGSRLYVLGACQTIADTTIYEAVTIRVNQHNGAFVSSSASSGGTSNVDYVNDFTRDADGNLYVAGAIEVTSEGYNTYVAKLDSTLALQWEAIYNGPDDLDDVANNIKVNSSGDVFITGYTTRTTSRKNWVTIQYDNSGSQQWLTTYNDTLNGDDEGMAMEIDDDGDIVVTGYDSTVINNLDYYTVKYNATTGAVRWSVRESSINGKDKALNMAIDNTGDIIITGESQKADGSYEYKTIKYAERNVITPTDFKEETVSNSFSFYENRGQLINMNDTLIPSIRYYTINAYPYYYIKDDGFSYVFTDIDDIILNKDTVHRIDLKFNSSLNTAKVYPMEENKEYANYFLGHIPTGVTEIHSNKRLITVGLYSNIDFEYSSNLNGAKYYLIVKPGGSPQSIGLEWTGATSLSLNGGTNELTINSSIGSVSYGRPTVYQLDNTNDTIHITGWTADWTANGASNKYKFNIGAYDNTKALIIEFDEGAPTPASPTNNNCTWSTHYGPGGLGNDVKTDATGRIYAAGGTASNLFPATSGALQDTLAGIGDVVVTKFSSNGSRLWATFYGGSKDSLNDPTYAFEAATAIALDNSGNIYVTGYTRCEDFPVFDPIGSTDYFQINGLAKIEDIFILELNPSGTAPLWATYYGGFEGIAQVERGNDLKLDALGNLYIVGDGNDNFPVDSLAGAYNSTTGEAFVLKFSSSKALTWATRIGTSLGVNHITSLAIDPSNNLYIAGESNYTGYPVVSGTSFYGGSNPDGVLTKFNTSNAISWSTYLGGAGSDQIWGIATNSSGNVFVTGNTNTDSLTFPLTNPGGSAYYDGTYSGASGGYGDAFVTEFSSAGTRLWSTYYGGTGGEKGTKIAVDDHNSIYITGRVFSTDFPIEDMVNGYEQDTLPTGTSSTAYIVAFKPDRDRIWSCYFGGGYDYANSLAVYKNEELYLVGFAGSPGATFPVDDGGGVPYYQGISTGGGSGDGFIARFDLKTTPLDVSPINNPSANLLIYPNPSNGEITLEIEQKGENDIKIEIFNITGQLVYTETIKKQPGIVKKELNIGNLAKGLYVVNIRSGEATSSKKIIIQ